MVGLSVGYNTALTVKCGILNTEQYLYTGVKELKICESDLMKGRA
jgi:hypothetical protein